MNKKLFAGLIGILAVGCTVLQSNPSALNRSYLNSALERARQRMEKGFAEDPFGYLYSANFQNVLRDLSLEEMNFKIREQRRKKLEGASLNEQNEKRSIVNRLDDARKQSPWQRIRNFLNFEPLVRDFERLKFQDSLCEEPSTLFYYEMPSKFDPVKQYEQPDTSLLKTMRYLLRPEKFDKDLRAYETNGAQGLKKYLADGMSGNMRQLPETTRLYDEIKRKAREYERFAGSQD